MNLPLTLIIEDDICFQDKIGDLWTTVLEPWMTQTADMHLCVLGYKPWQNSPAPERVTHGGQTVFSRYIFEGAHCYAVTRKGAEILVRLAFPMQVHVDLWLGLLMEFRLINGFVWLGHAKASSGFRMVLNPCRIDRPFLSPCGCEGGDDNASGHRNSPSDTSIGRWV